MSFAKDNSPPGKYEKNPYCWCISTGYRLFGTTQNDKKSSFFVVPAPPRLAAYRQWMIPSFTRPVVNVHHTSGSFPAVSTGRKMEFSILVSFQAQIGYWSPSLCLLRSDSCMPEPAAALTASHSSGLIDCEQREKLPGRRDEGVCLRSPSSIGAGDSRHRWGGSPQILSASFGSSLLAPSTDTSVGG